MEYLFLLGRFLYGGFFILGGINHFRHLEMMSGYAAFKKVPAPKAAVIVSGVVLLIGGLSIVTGIKPAVGVICLAIFLIPVSFMIHTYWSDTDEHTKINNRVNFQKNLAMLGAGLALLMVPQPWPLSLLKFL